MSEWKSWLNTQPKDRIIQWLILSKDRLRKQHRLTDDLCLALAYWITCPYCGSLQGEVCTTKHGDPYPAYRVHERRLCESRSIRDGLNDE